VRSLSGTLESIAVGAILVDASDGPVFVNEAASACSRPAMLRLCAAFAPPRRRHRALRQAIAGQVRPVARQGPAMAAALSATVFAPPLLLTVLPAWTLGHGVGRAKVAIFVRG